VLVLYPLVAVAAAGWVAGLKDVDHTLSVLPRYILPLIAVGQVVVMATNATLVAASYGLYLGIGAAFAIVPGIPGRRLLGLSCLVGFMLLVAFQAERGPTLTVLLAALSAWLAASRFRSRGSGRAAMVAVLIVITGTALAFSLGIARGPTQIPIVGRVIERATATSSSDPEAANNVGLRTAAWSYALNATYVENPLLGVGAYHPIELTFHGNDLATNPGTGVHNSFIGYVFYAGYPAGLLVVLVFVLGVLRIWRIRRLTVYAPALLGALVAVVVTALTNVALETTYIGGPSWLVLAGAVGLAGRYSPA
jgi:O-antigen ligase